jgi:hypothetical protein
VAFLLSKHLFIFNDMINLNFGNNNVALTLKESTTISNPNYLFQFINATSLEEVVFIASDTSNFKDRYNLFVIQLVNANAKDLLTGKIYLNDTGYWTYNVYQQASPTNLNLELTGALVETGKVLYNFTQDDTIELEQDNKVIIYG